MAEWEAFYTLEPWGFEMETNRYGVVCSTMANCMAGKKGGGSFGPDDFFVMPEKVLEKLRKKQTTEEMRELLMSMVPEEEKEKIELRKIKERFGV